MPKPYAVFSFRDFDGTDLRYGSDTGTQYEINTRLVIPPHLSAAFDTAKMNAIASAMKAHPVYFTNAAGVKTVVNNFGSNPCSAASLLYPRKIRFYFNNGSSVSVAVGDAGAGILTARTALKTALETETVKVICANLEGEEIGNINDIVNVAFVTTAATTTAGSGAYYSGVLKDYKSEITNTSEPLPFKILSATRTAPAIISANVATCLGDVLPSGGLVCPGRSSLITTRRLVVAYQITASSGIFETREIPVKTVDDVITCANAIAQVNGVFCIGYKGEDRKSIHLIA